MESEAALMESEALVAIASEQPTGRDAAAGVQNRVARRQVETLERRVEFVRPGERPFADDDRMGSQ